MKQTNKKRQTIYIQRDFQRKSMLVVIGIIAASGLFSAALLYMLLSSELSSELQLAHSQIKNTWERLAPAVIFGNLITVVITSIAAAIAVLYQSHKIAGPLYRLQKVCEEVVSGNLNPITSLRKADQLTALANAFELMIDCLRKKDSTQQENISQALDTLQQLKQENSNKELIENLENYLNDLKN